MNVSFWIQFILTIIVFILQFFNIYPWTELFFIIHAEVISIIVGIIIAFFKNDILRKQAEKKIYIILIIIGSFLLADIIRYYLDKTSDNLIKYSIWGIIVLLIYQSLTLSEK